MEEHIKRGKQSGKGCKTTGEEREMVTRATKRRCNGVEQGKVEERSANNRECKNRRSRYKNARASRSIDRNQANVKTSRGYIKGNIREKKLKGRAIDRKREITSRKSQSRQ